MFGDLDQPLGQIEHLSLLHPRLHRPGQDAEAAATDARRVPLDPVRRLDPLERVALVPSLPAARLARLPAKAPGNARLLLQPVARRRLRAVGAVLSQLPSKLSDLPRKAAFSARSASFSRRSSASSRRSASISSPISIARLTRTLTHITRRPVEGTRSEIPISHRTCGNSDSPLLGSYKVA
jgi:hypothetical protein